MQNLKVVAVVLILFTSTFVQAEEYVLPDQISFYDAKGNLKYKGTNPAVELKGWAPHMTWHYYHGAVNGATYIKNQAYIAMTTDQGVPVYVPVSAIANLKPVAKKDFIPKSEHSNCIYCTSNKNKNPVNTMKDDVGAAEQKSKAGRNPIEALSYRSKIPKLGNFKNCSNFIETDGSLGPLGRALFDEMKANEDNHTRSNSNMRILCPKFDSFSAEKKFDFNLWVILALVAQESACKPAVKSPERNPDGTCFNNPSTSTNCKVAYGLCQLDANPSAYGCGNLMRGGGMTNGTNNIKCCSRIYQKHNIVGNKVIGLAGNHFGPFNAPNSKPNFQHFISQWSKECRK